MFPPQVYIIGAQKAGTTYLANLLSQHPDVALSSPKEAAFYTRHWDRGLEWYRSRFPSAEQKILVDATPGYTAAPLPGYPGNNEPEAWRFAGVPERIHSVAPGASFIYLLRNPIDRTYSSYWHNMRNGTETRAFRDAITSDTFYLRVSDYAAQLRLYLDYFPLEVFHIIFFDDLRSRPAEVAGTCFRFLGLPDDVPLDVRQGKNRSYTYNRAGAFVSRVAGRRGSVMALSRRLRAFLPAPVLDILFNTVTRQIPPISAEDRAFLSDFFSGRNKAVEELIQKKIPDWS